MSLAIAGVVINVLVEISAAVMIFFMISPPVEILNRVWIYALHPIKFSTGNSQNHHKIITIS
jgi:hypothetical protein